MKTKFFWWKVGSLVTVFALLLPQLSVAVGTASSKELITLSDLSNPQKNLFPLPVVTNDKVYDFTQNGLSKDEQGAAYKVMDASTDVAEMGNKKVVRIYKQPRPIYKDANGVFRNYSAKTAVFNKKPEAAIVADKNGGYSFSYAASSQEMVTVTADGVDMGGAKTKPVTSESVVSANANYTKTTLANVYPGVDVAFLDKNNKREKIIILKNKPAIAKGASVVTFWEKYSYPAGATLLTWNDKPLKDGAVFDVTPIKIKMANGETFVISPAIAFDATNREEALTGVPTKVKINVAKRELNLGIQVSAAYLNDPARVYPVTIDPAYYACGVNNDLGCTSYNDYYYRQSTVNNVDARVPVADGDVYIGSGLYTGYNKSGNDKFAREIAVYFGTTTIEKFVQKGGEVVQASLNMYFLKAGNGAYANPINVEAKYVDQNCGDVNVVLKYKDLASCIVSINNPVSVNPGANGVWYSWDISQKIKDWQYFPQHDRGFIIEPSGSWAGNIANAPNWNDRLLTFKASEDAASASGNDPYLKVTLEFPDLIDGATSAVDVSPGGQEPAVFRVRNIGQAAAPAAPQVTYYVNPMASCQTKNNPLVTGSYFINSPIAPNQTDVQNVTIPIPGNAAPGQYCLYFEIDSNKVVIESDETNNTQLVTFNILVGAKPDLTTTNASLDKLYYRSGDNVGVKYTVQNIGGAAMKNFTTVAYLVDNVDSGTQNMVPVLNPGQSVVLQDSGLRLANNIALGNHTLKFFADDGNWVDEGDEFNNTATVNFGVIDKADLGVSFISADDGHAYRLGDTVAVNATVQNIGNSTVNNVPYKLILRDVHTGTWYPLTDLAPGSINLPAGFNQVVVLSGVIPQNLPPSSYYQVGVRLDPDDQVPEVPSNLSNDNYSFNSILVEHPIFQGDSNNNGVPDNAEIQAGIFSPSPSVPLVGKNQVKINKASATDLGGVAVANSTKTNTNAPSTPAVINQGGDPVNMRTGALELEQKDLEIPGRGQFINLTRTYNSRTPDLNGRFGKGWSSSYDMYYYQDPATKNVQIYLGGAVAATFSTPDNGATFNTPTGYTDTLTVINNGLEYRTQDGVRYQFTTTVSDGMKMLTSIIDPNNNTTLLGYTPTRGIQLLTSITDPSGRKVTITYPDSNGPLWDKVWMVEDTINGQGTRSETYAYDLDGTLTSVTQNRIYQGFAENSIVKYTYDADGHLLTYTNPLNSKLTNEYDADGRVLLQYETNPRIDAPGTKRLVYEFTYNDGADPNVPGSKHCTSLKTYRDKNTFYTSKQCFDVNELKIYESDGLGNYEKWTYDNSGLILTHRNKNGDVTTYTYDVSRRLATITPPDTGTWHSETAFTYENNYNRVLSQTDTMWPLAHPAQKTTRVTSYTVDVNNGNVLTVTDALGKIATSTYDNYGNVDKLYSRSGTVTIFGYDFGNNYVESKNTELKQADGSILTVTVLTGHDADGNLTHFEDGRNFATSYYYDSRHNVRKETSPYGESKTYTYDLMGHRITMTDERGFVTKYTYDSDLNASLIKVEQVGQNHTIARSRTYDFAGNLKTEKDGNGNITTYEYDDANYVHKKIGPRNTIVFGYDSNGKVTSEVNSLNEKITHDYNERGQETEKRLYKTANTYAAFKIAYDGFGRTLTTTDGNSNDTAYSYDALNHVLTKTDAQGGLTTYRYDDDGNQVGERSPRAELDQSLRNQYGDSTTSFYDGFGHRIKEVNSLGKITTHFYDANGNLVKTVDRQSLLGKDADHVTQFEYDKRNLLTKQTFADGSHIDYTYDKAGNRDTKTDQENRTWVYGYDEFNRVAFETDPASKVEQYGYDDNNNKTTVTYRDSTAVHFLYNADNAITTITDEQGNTETFTYDEAGNKKTYTDKLNHTTLYDYDNLNRLQTQTDAAGTVTTYTYDDNNNRLSTAVGSVITSYIYDALNRLKTTTYPTSKTAKITYDENGNVKTTVDGKNQTITYAYDALNRVDTKTLPGNVVTQYNYDNWNNVLTSDGPTEKIVSTYDALNRERTAEHTIVDLNKKYNILTEYALDGQVKKRTDGAGKAIDYGYTNRGELFTVGFGTTTLASYAYTDVGKPRTISYGNGLVSTWSYDNLNRPTGVSITNAQSAEIFSQTYSYDAAGNRLSFNDNKESTTTYQYDLLDQLKSVDYSTVNGVGSNDLTFNYDDNGNRTSAVTPFGSTSYGYTAATNELKTVGYNGTRLSVATQFDNNGSLSKETYLRLGKADKVVTYGWDEQNRLASITYANKNRPAYLPSAPDNTLTFAYDDAGNRIQKTINDVSSYYINTGLSVLNELDANGTVTKTIVAGLSEVAEIASDGTITYTHQDALGSTVLITNSAGEIVSRYQFDPFGQLIGKNASSDTNYLFTGQEFDAESDLYYYNARYYSPALGRFISRDPMMGAQDDTLGYNEYAYVRNNPLRYVDPSGMEAKALLKQQSDASWAKYTNQSSWDSWVIDVGNGGEYLYNNSLTAKLIMDHPVATGVVVAGSLALVYYSPAIVSAIGPAVIERVLVQGTIGASYNLAMTKLSSLADGREVSASEYLYSAGAGFLTAQLPGGTLSKGVLSGTTNLVQQVGYKNGEVDYKSVGISIVGGTLVAKSLAPSSLSVGIDALTKNPIVTGLAESALNFNFEQLPQLLNTFISGALKK